MIENRLLATGGRDTDSNSTCEQTSKLLQVRILSRISGLIFELQFPVKQGIELEKKPKYFVSFLRTTKLIAVLHDIILYFSQVHTLCFV